MVFRWLSYSLMGKIDDRMKENLSLFTWLLKIRIFPRYRWFNAKELLGSNYSPTTFPR